LELSININSLKNGDVVYNTGSGQVYTVTSSYKNRATAVRSIDITNPNEWELVTDHILHRAVPIHYSDLNHNDRWCIVKIKSGKLAGESACLVMTFKDESIVDLGSSETGDYNLHYVKNSDIDFNLEEHLKTNKLIEEANGLRKTGKT
jgi:hypothetical protein